MGAPTDPVEHTGWTSLPDAGEAPTVVSPQPAPPLWPSAAAPATRAAPAPSDAPAAREAPPGPPRSAPVALTVRAPGGSPVPIPAGAEAVDVLPDRLTSKRRSRQRRRLRHLRRVHEVLLRDLGGLVFDVHRFADPADQQHHADLLAAKLARLRAVDAEVRDLEDRLGDKRAAVLREPGIGGVCPSCGELFGSEATFCWRCGTQVSGLQKPRPMLAVGPAVVTGDVPPQTLAPAPGAPPPPASTPAPSPDPVEQETEGAGPPRPTPAPPPAAPTGDEAPTVVERADEPLTTAPEDWLPTEEHAALGTDEPPRRFFRRRL